MYRIVFGVVLIVLINYVGGENTEIDNVATNSSTVPRCYQFTWLGPRFNNESIFMNATCTDATRLYRGTPCFQPLVATYDGTRPDLNYMWTNYRQNSTCILADNDVCATYTYYFNGQVENSTYMCSRAVDPDGQAITSGCYTQVNGSYSTRACFCRSIPGGMPCNSVTSVMASFTVVLICVVAMLNGDVFNLWRN